MRWLLVVLLALLALAVDAQSSLGAFPAKNITRGTSIRFNVSYVCDAADDPCVLTSIALPTGVTWTATNDTSDLSFVITAALDAALGDHVIDFNLTTSVTQSFELTVNDVISFDPSSAMIVTSLRASPRLVRYNVTGGTAPLTVKSATSSNQDCVEHPTDVSLTGFTAKGFDETGSATVTVVVEDGVGATAQFKATFTVMDAASIDGILGGLQHTVGAQFNITGLSVSKGIAPYTVGLTSNATGVLNVTGKDVITVDAAGPFVISGLVGAAVGFAQLTVFPTDAHGALGDGLTIRVEILPAPSVTLNITEVNVTMTGALPNFATGIQLSGGKLPVVLTVVSSNTTVCTGATFNAGTGNFEPALECPQAGTADLVFTATDADGVTGTHTVAVTVHPLPMVDTGFSQVPVTSGGSVPDFAADMVYSGGIPPYTLAAVSSVPAVCNSAAFNFVTGEFVPAIACPAAGSTNISFTITDSTGVSTTHTVEIRVNAPGQFVFSAGSSAAAPLQLTQGRNATLQLTINDGTAPFGTITVTAPSGLEATVTGAGMTTRTVDIAVAADATTGEHTLDVSTTDFSSVGITGSIYVNVTEPPTVVALWSDPVTCTAGATATIGGASFTGGVAPVALTASVADSALATVSGVDPVAGTLVCAGLVAGTTSVTITATDANGAVGSKTATLVVAPALSVVPANATVEGTVGKALPSVALTTTGGTQPVTIDVTASSDATVYAAADADVTTSLLSFPELPTKAGTADLTVTAEDDRNSAVNFDVTLTVNAEPAFASVADTQAGSGLPFSVAMSITGGTLPFSLLAATSNDTAIPSASLAVDGLAARALTLTGTVEPLSTPTPVEITVRVADAFGAEAEVSFVVSVRPGPIISGAPSDYRTTVGVDNGAFDVTVSGGTQPVTFSRSSNDQSVLPNGNIGVTDNGDGTYTIAPTQNGQTGIAIITLTAEDDFGLQYNVTINYHVEPLATVSIGNATTTAGRNVSVTYTIAGGNGPFVVAAAFESAASDKIWVLPSTERAGSILLTGPEAAGWYKILLDVTDAAGAASSAEFSVYVNEGPSFDGLPTEAVVTTGTRPTDAISFNATFGTRVRTLTVSSSNEASVPSSGIKVTGSNGAWSLTLEPVAPGNGQIWLTVTDEAGAVAMGSFDFIVNANPSLTGAVTSGVTTAGRPLLTAAVFTGAEGTGALTFVSAVSDNTAVVADANIAVDPTANANEWELTVSSTGAAGTATITITIQDSLGVQASATFQLTVNALPTVSAAAATAETSIGRSTAAIGLTLALGTGEYTLAATSSNASVIPSQPASFVFAGTGASRTLVLAGAALAGSSDITITVTDAAGASGTAMLTLTVNPVPVFAPVAAVTNTGGFNVSVDLALTYGTGAITVTAASSKAAVVNAGKIWIRQISSREFRAHMATERLSTNDAAVVTLTATDAVGAVATTTVTVNALAWPSIAAIGDVSTDVSSTAEAVTVTVSGGSAPYTFTAVSQNLAVVAANGITVTGEGASRNIAVTTTDKVGSAVIVVTVTDAAGAVAQARFSVSAKGKDGSRPVVRITLRLTVPPASVDAAQLATDLGAALGVNARRIRFESASADAAGSIVTIIILPPQSESDTKEASTLAAEIALQAADSNSAFAQTTSGRNVDTAYVPTVSDSVQCPSGDIAATPAACPEEDDEIPFWYWIVGAVVVFILLLLLAFCCFKYRPCGQKTLTTSSGTSESFSSGMSVEIGSMGVGAKPVPVPDFEAPVVDAAFSPPQADSLLAPAAAGKIEF